MEGQQKQQKKMMIEVREFMMERDAQRAEEMERRCEVGPSGSVALYTDLQGDPLCRIRHSPLFIMLVAEYGPEKEMVGLIRVSIKTVVRGTNSKSQGLESEPLFAKTAYILGLRVSPNHRRKGIGLKLVEEAEKWAMEKGAEYVYMATEKENEACISLFVDKRNFCKFRTPAILVHPVHQHSKPAAVASKSKPRSAAANQNPVQIHKLSIPEATALYRTCFGTVEFFPADIEAVLGNPLSLGTFVAMEDDEEAAQVQSIMSMTSDDDDDEAEESESESNSSKTRFRSRSRSWAVASVWNCSQVFKMKVKGVSVATRFYAAMSRALDRALPWLSIPSIPNVFRPFGLYFVYGVYSEGPRGADMALCLWSSIHNMARRDGNCAVIATELGACDPLRQTIPHWHCFSCTEDLWCIKKLISTQDDPQQQQEEKDWTQSPPGTSIFVDPREF